MPSLFEMLSSKGAGSAVPSGATPIVHPLDAHPLFGFGAFDLRRKNKC